MSQQIKPPKIDWIWLENYNLEDLEREFDIATFERRLDNSHVNHILDGIIKNEFFDIVIRAIDNGKGQKRSIIDGQHRIRAFIKAYKEHGVKNYTFMLALYPKEYARIIYRRLNIGKVLSVYDHGKAMDMGAIPFFERLRKWVRHYRDPSHLGFMDVLFTLQYFKNPKKGWADKSQLDNALYAVTEEDIQSLEKFLQSMLEEAGTTVYKNNLYKMAVYRNIYRIGRERHYNLDDYTSFIGKVKKNPQIEERLKLNGKQQLEDLYTVLNSIGRKKN